MSENAGELTLRPFATRDFPQLADLMAATWLPEFPGLPGTLAATVELCSYLERTTWSLVAERDGRLLGAVLVAEGDEAQDAATWSRRSDEALREARESPACQRAIALEMAGVEEGRGLEDEFATTGAPEAACAIKLLIVTPDSRGTGIGGRFFSSARELLRARGARGYHLLTDDSCDVSFYDHMGLSRVVRRRSLVDWPGAAPDEDFGIYLYAERF